MKFFAWYLLLLLISIGSFGQRFGGNPSGTKWNQINAASVKVIYPSGMDSAAARVATVSELLHKNYASTIGSLHKKISIVLQPDVNYSNAYVGLGPYRSEFFMMPPQNPFELGSISWPDNLAVHEFRHVQQYSNFNVGLSKLMGILGGQNGRAVANAMSVPDWFFEGDAVWNETILTNQGRGRLPSFFGAYKSVYRDERKYSYQKMHNGSLRNFVPNHYDLGYLLVSYGRQQYGDSIWHSVTQHAAAYKTLIYPMQGAVKKYMGIPFNTFVDNAMSDFRDKWKAQIATEPAWITAESQKNVSNYQYPYPLANGGSMVLKTSYNEVPAFVEVAANGKEQKIAIKEIGYDDYFSYKNGRIVYTALQPDVRWANRDYSIIKLLDVATKESFSVTTKTRLFSPDITDDGQQIVAVEMKPTKYSLLVLLNTEGQIQKQFTPDSSYVFSHPKFLQENTSVLASVRRPDGKMGMLIWETNSNTTRWLLPPAERLVGFPIVQGDTVFYTASESGVDGLYASIISSGKRFLLNNYPTGIYQGFVHNGTMLGSYFTASGYRLGKMPASFSTVLSSESGFIPLYQQPAQQVYANISEVSTVRYASKKYSKFFKPLNFHSWQPELNEPDYTFRVLGNNVINTTLTDVFYTYNTNENSHAAGANFTYGGLFIQPTIGARQTWGREVVYNEDTTFIYNESEAYGGFILPLNLTGGKQFRSLILSTTLHSDRVKWQGIGKDLLRNADYTFAQARLTYSSQIQKARQHMFPRFAQALTADYKTMTDNHKAWQMLVNGSIYLPGFSRNHSVVLTGAWQGRDTARQYAYSNSFPFSRGYSSVNFPRMWKVGANYHLPIIYPDWGFGNIVYFLRVRGNAFYDFTEVKSLRTGLTRQFRSTGAEMFFETRWWNQLPVTVGFRYSRLLDSDFSGANSNQWEFILPVNLF